MCHAKRGDGAVRSEAGGLARRGSGTLALAYAAGEWRGWASQGLGQEEFWN